MLVKELVYMCLDLIKGTSDDSYITERHIIFLLKKYRSLLIKKEQEKDKAEGNEPPDSEYQQICLELVQTPVIDGEPCNTQYMLKSTKPIPDIEENSFTKVFPLDYYQNIYFSWITKERMRFVGTNKYLQNIIYVSRGTDDHIYMTSNNLQFLNLEGIRMKAIFDDFEKANELACDDDACAMVCDVMDMEFPMREYLVPTLIELVTKEALGAHYRPADRQNDAADNLAELATFLRNNAKSALRKQIEG